ncbi:hypothetical protein VNI00_002926 [Paramarasmius palmivorus]|uniref:Uncharacterized protein n=1 Tax=Paramarasmius palmivorus TaxID=297713 RepID=A0AAW0DYB9_9AGAR
MVVLEVTIRYLPSKQARYARLPTKELVKNLQDDLRIMRLPFPPTANVKPHREDGIEFYWETSKGSPLYNAVTHIIREQDRIKQFRERKESCEIEQIILGTGCSAGANRKAKDKKPHSFDATHRAQRRDYWGRRESIDSAQGPGGELLAQPASRHNDVYSRPPRQTSRQRRSISEIESIQSALIGITHSLDEPGHNTMDEKRIGRLTDELHDLKQSLSSLASKGTAIEQQLRLLEGQCEDGIVAPLDGDPDVDCTDIRSKLAALENELQIETKKRERAEWQLSDVLRECQEPVVVPQFCSVLGFATHLTIKYGPRKMSQYREMDLKEMARRLRCDLDLLKLPHPPEANINPPTEDGITFFWTTKKNSPLLNTIEYVLTTQGRPDIKKLKTMCEIEEILIKKGPDDGTHCQPPRYHNNPSYSSSRYDARPSWLHRRDSDYAPRPRKRSYDPLSYFSRSRSPSNLSEETCGRVNKHTRILTPNASPTRSRSASPNTSDPGRVKDSLGHRHRSHSPVSPHRHVHSHKKRGSDTTIPQDRSYGFDTDSGYFERRGSFSSNAAARTASNAVGYSRRSPGPARKRAVGDIESIQATLIDISDSFAADQGTISEDDRPLPPRPSFLPLPPRLIEEESTTVVEEDITRNAFPGLLPSAPASPKPLSGEDYIPLLPISPEKPSEGDYEGANADPDTSSEFSGASPKKHDGSALYFTSALDSIVQTTPGPEQKHTNSMTVPAIQNASTIPKSLLPSFGDPTLVPKLKWVPIGLKPSESDNPSDTTSKAALDVGDGDQPSDAKKAFHLTRQFWDNRRELMALSARGTKIETQLRELQNTQKWKEHDFLLGEEKMCSELQFEFKIMEGILREETRLREKVEMSLADVLRECAEPNIVPQLLRAFGLVLG